MLRIHFVRLVFWVAIALLGANLPAGLAAATAVGRTEAAYGVTPNGDASFSIPIRVTDDVVGLTPRLAISYTGPETRTVLGVGIALSGISIITACRQTIAQDLNAAPVLLTSADRFCLDGARLRRVTGTYGAAGTTYRTELDRMIRVTSVTSTNGIPDWFKAEMPDGLKYEYGRTANSKLLASGISGAPPQFWAVNKISDSAGNSISFVYDTDNALRRFRPNYIQYTERSGIAHYKISFVYQSTIQPFPTQFFKPSATGGAAHSDDKLLDHIELLHDSTVYRKYLFTYESGAGTNSRLKTVQECVPVSGFPDDCLPATILTWQAATAGHGAAVPSSTVASGVIPLDINGDGIEDVAWPSGGTWRYMLGSATGYGSVINTSVAVTNFGKAMPLEWNADGFDDLLIDWSDGKWRVLKGSATGLATSPVQAGSGTGTPSNAAGTSWTVVDADGDGRDDLLSMATTGTVVIKKYPNSSSGFGAVTNAYSDSELQLQGIGFIKKSGASAIKRPDFNGDGRTDLLIYACRWITDKGAPHCSPGPFSEGWYVLISNGTTYIAKNKLNGASYQSDVRYGDFNNDGLTDLVYPTVDKWYLRFGQGNGWLSPVTQGPSDLDHATYQTLTGDYDGDGYDDLYVTTNSPWQWIVFRGTGTGLSMTPITTGLSAAGLGWMLTDYNGDGLKDMARYDATSFLWSTYPHLGLPGERLISAIDGLANAVTFNYLPMTNSTVYTKGTGTLYPNRDYQSAKPLVRTVQVSPGGSTSYSIEYKYVGARIDNQGRSFLGMASRTATDKRNDVLTTESYRQDFPYIGAPAIVTVKQPGGVYTIQSVTNTYANHVLDATAGNQRYLPYRSSSVAKFYEVGGIKNGLLITQVTENDTVNTLGNTTVGSVFVDDKDSGMPEFGFRWQSIVTTVYKEDQANWCITPPTSRSDRRILPDLTEETYTANWVVSGLECRVTQQTLEPGAGSALSLVTDLGYDICGNVNSISSYPAGTTGQQRVTGINYGMRCQRPETITNPLNQASTIAYNWPLALPSTQTDPNGIAVNLDYDGFGRLTRQLRPDGTASRFALTACTAGNSWCGKNSGARVKVTRTERNTSNAILRTDEQFLNGLGQLRWSHSDSLESGPAIVETLYDVFGQPSQQTQPYFAAGVVYSTSYLRDLVGRVTQVNAPIDEANTSGRMTGFAYEGRDFKVTDPRNFTATRRSNALGQLRSNIDPSPGGTTSYAYHPFGDLASITDAASNVTSWSHNLRGFVTATSDPDAGSWTYVLNAFGEMTSQTDAKSQITTFTYDKLSRPLTRVNVAPAGTTSFTWGNSAAAKNIGQLASIASPGSYSESYTFDSLGRLSTQTVNADGSPYLINLAYHAQTGLLDTLQYPTSTSGYRLKVAYDYSSNLLQKVRDFNGSTVFWQATSTDAFGHIQDETFGNGVLTFTDFDQASGLMTAREGGLGGGTGLINSQVAWDLNGNLTQRKDLKLSPIVTEDFFYDSLNRLDRSNRNGTPNQDLTLNAIGNILWKKDVCPSSANCYTYHATKKRAVIGAGSSSFGYDANGNMTSRNGSTIGYTSYNLPSVISSGSNSSTLTYGAFHNRYKQVAINAGTTETTIYVAGLLEKFTRGSLVKWRHVIQGGNGVAAIYTRRSGSASNTDTAYLHADHLGSPELLTDDAGADIVRLSFGAYGERRDGSDWDGPPSAADLTTIGNYRRRGLTGHEHLDAVGMIHMNGRVYEPVAGRFLSVDPIVRLGHSQSPNSYSYVWNNPLTLVDPSGFDPPDATDSLGPPWNCGGRLSCSDLGDLLGAGPTPVPQPFPPVVSRDTDSLSTVGGTTFPLPYPWPTIDWEGIAAAGSRLLGWAAIIASSVTISGSTPDRTSFYHGTDVTSAVALLNGASLSAEAAMENRNYPAADLGFYLATDLATAEDFALRAGGAQGGTVVGVTMTRHALYKLRTVGGVFRPIPGPVRYPGVEFFLPPTAFGTFDSLRSGGDIVLWPATPPPNP